MMEFKHQDWMDLFARSPGINDADHLGVTVEHVPGATARCIGVHVLANDENFFDHHAQLAVVGPDGQRIPGSVVLYDWEGRTPIEHAGPIALDKPMNEPPGNLTLTWDMTVDLWVEGHVSDIVRGIHTRHPAIDQGDANHDGHWSYFCCWMIDGDTVPEPPVLPDPPVAIDLTQIILAARDVREGIDEVIEMLGAL